MIRYQIIRNADGWQAFGLDLTFESLMRVFPTRRAVITEMQLMRMDEEAAAVMAMRLLQDDD